MPVWTSMTWTSSPGVWSRPREQTIWVSLVLRVTVATRCGRRPAPDRTGVGTEGAGAAMVRSEREKGGPFNSRVEVVVGVEESEKRRVTPPPFVLAVPRQPSKVFLPATTITKLKGRCRIKCVYLGGIDYPSEESQGSERFGARHLHLSGTGRGSSAQGPDIKAPPTRATDPNPRRAFLRMELTPMVVQTLALCVSSPSVHDSRSLIECLPHPFHLPPPATSSTLEAPQ